jgi:pentapeptide MXKDX repeat protein
MSKIASVIVAAAFALAASRAALPQDSMTKGSMQKDGTTKESMSKDGTKKSDGMTKQSTGGMTKDGMKKDDGMQKGMSK